MLIARIILIVCLIAAVSFGIFVYIYLKKPVIKKKTNSYSEIEDIKKNSNDEKMGINELKALIGVEGICNGIIKTIYGGYLIIISISSPDKDLMTDEGENLFDSRLQQFSLALSFPIQFFTSTSKTETKDFVANVDSTIDSVDPLIPDLLKNYSQLYKDAVMDMGMNSDNYVRQNHCIIGVNGMPDEKRSLYELQNRVDTVCYGLSKARIKVELLDTPKTLQFLHDVFFYKNNFNIQDMIKKGVLELYSCGLGINYGSSEEEITMNESEVKVNV